MPTTRPSPRNRRLRAVAVATVLALALVACGDDGDEPEAEAPPETTETEATLPDAESIDVGAEVWFAGFRVEVEEAALVADEVAEAAVVEVAISVENLRDDDAAFPSQELELQWDADAATADFSGGGVVRTGATARETVTFRVDEAFAFDDAVLSAGTPNQIQAIVPLTDPDEAVAAAPIELEAPAEDAAEGTVEVSVTDLTLLASDPAGFQPEQQPADEPILAVTLDLTLLDDPDPDATVQYDANIGAGEFRLELPDGTQVAPSSAPIELVARNSTERGLAVYFPVRDIPFDADDLTGSEELTFTVAPSSVGPEDEVSFTFELVAMD